MVDLTNYTRWITASIFKHIDSNRQGVRLYVEGEVRDTQKYPQWFEARVNGPLARPCGSMDEYIFDVDVDILCSQLFVDDSVYGLQKLLGIAQQILSKDIEIKRYGDGPCDDNTYVGWLQLKGKLTGPHVHDFGQIEDTTRISQGTVEAGYHLYL